MNSKEETQYPHFPSVKNIDRIQTPIELQIVTHPLPPPTPHEQNRYIVIKLSTILLEFI